MRTAHTKVIYLCLIYWRQETQCVLALGLLVDVYYSVCFEQLDRPGQRSLGVQRRRSSVRAKLCVRYKDGHIDWQESETGLER